jgi:hypothetical protein
MEEFNEEDFARNEDDSYVGYVYGMIKDPEAKLQWIDICLKLTE